MRLTILKANRHMVFLSLSIPVLCRVGLKEPSAVGFRIVSDTLLFYRMVQGHFRQLRFWAWYGSTSGDASFDFREGETGKSPALPSKQRRTGHPEGQNRRLGHPSRSDLPICLLLRSLFRLHAASVIPEGFWLRFARNNRHRWSHRGD